MAFCSDCGRPLAHNSTYCDSCGARISWEGNNGSAQAIYAPIQTSPFYLPQKSPIIAGVLGFVPGLIGLWGVGHIYARQTVKGIFLLIAGITIFASIIAISSWLVVLLLIGWLWQTYDAYKNARTFNDLTLQYGRAP